MTPVIADREKKIFLIYLDILGFEALPLLVSKRAKIIDERKVRSDFLAVIEERISSAQRKELLLDVKKGRDDWLIAVPSIDSVLELTLELFSHNTGYVGFEKIPLEMVIGCGTYDQFADLPRNGLICESTTINFLKQPLTTAYHEWYRSTFSKKITSSYVLVTSEVHERLNYYEKMLCRQITVEFLSKEQQKQQFFVVEFRAFIERAKVLPFLKTVNKPEQSSYRRIDCTFIAPNEYEQICEILEKQKVVFLVGDPEIGKTFTAARLLWEYYLKGYNPVWHSGGEKDEREENRKRLSEGGFESRTIAYFEDPFGKTQFEDREDLRRVIAAKISQIQSLDTRVIISSREEIFNDFKRENLSAKDLSDFTIELRLMKPSYSEKNRRNILKKWAYAFDCKWVHTSFFKLVLQISGKLVTPLSLWDFAASSTNLKELPDLMRLMHEKSKAVRASFAEEIAKMPRERILYLSLIILLQDNDSRTVSQVYANTVKRIVEKSYLSNIETVAHHFESKVILEDKDGRKMYNFTHPSYEEAVINSWKRPDLHDFMLSLLELLAKDNEPLIRGSCGFNLIRFFDVFPFQKEALSVINTLSKDKKPLPRLVMAVGLERYFGRLNDNLRMTLLESFMNDSNGELRARAVSIVSYYVDLVPYPDTVRLITQALDDRAARVRYEATNFVQRHFELLTLDIIKKATDVSKALCGNSNWYISYLSSFTYDSIEEKAKKRFSKEVGV